MELRIDTTKLQDMVSKAIHCASNNKLIPMTSLINISVWNGKLTLATTDATNYFYVSLAEKVDCEDFEVSVMADLFTKLVQKTTSSEVKITLEDKVMVVKGNGTYKIELPLNEKAKPITFPIMFDDSAFTKEVDTIDLSAVRSVILSNKTSLATDMKHPVLTGYYCGKSVITSNKKVVCWRNTPLLKKATVLSPTVMDLLSVCSDDKANVYVKLVDAYHQSSAFIFKTNTEIIYAPEFSDSETFPIESVDKLVNQEFESKCVVSRTSILDILDRLSLFVTAYDKKSINMTFSEKGIIFSSKKSSGEELVQYESVENFKPFSCQIHIEYLQNQLSSQDTDTVELSFGSEIAIKLTSENVVRIVALIKDNEVS